MKYKIHLLLISLLFAKLGFAQKKTPLIPADKGLSKQYYHNLYNDTAKTIYRGEQLKTIGMPVGGIAAGQLYIRGDGTLAKWWIANNAYNTGYGIPATMNMASPFGNIKNCYQTYTPESFVDQGFKVSIKIASGKIITRKLNKTDFDNISFNGEYPIATVNYADKRAPLPLDITMQAFSPFIPLDARESATPGTYLVFKLKNTSNQKLDINLAGWLQNMVCMELKNKASGTLRNVAVKEASDASLVMDLVQVPSVTTKKPIVFDDFEDGTYKNWTVIGKAFGTKPAEGTLKDQNDVSGYAGKYLVNSFYNGDDTKGTMLSKTFTINRTYINFLIGGGNKPGKEAFNLIVDGKIVRTATGGDDEELVAAGWNVSAYQHKKARLQIIDNATGPWGHINVDSIVFNDHPYSFIPDITTHPYFGNVALTVLNPDGQVITDIGNQSQATSTKPLGNKLVGQVGVNLSLKPGEEREVVYILSWYFPNRPKDYDGGGWARPLNTRGPAIGNMYSNLYKSSLDVAKWMSDNRSRLFTLTHLFHDTYYNHSSLPNWLNERLMMPVSTLATETCQWWATGKFWAWEGVGSCDGTCTHVWNYEQAMAHLFPELERNVREQTDFSTSFQPDGGINTRNGTDGVKIDGHIGTILKSYREYLMSDSAAFLTRNWPKIKMAMQYAIRQDGADGKVDGMLTIAQPNTYDIAFYGANTFVGSLYLSALQAAQKMALQMGDKAFADSCGMIYQSGREQTVKNLWNGQYFIQTTDAKEHPENQYMDGCLSDQLFGQTWAHMLNLGYIYPEDEVKTALTSIYKYNWTTDVGAYIKIHAPDRFYAGDGEPGLLITTWPAGDYLPKGVIYKNEVWTGVEYQVATNMIYDGMMDEALSIIKGIDERYSPEKHNPWNEIECGDHYVRAMASWGVLLALQNYDYDGPEATLAFAPQLKPQAFESFFTAAKGWGNISQQVSSGTQQDGLQLKYGELHLKQFTATLKDGGTAKNVSAYLSGKQVDVKWQQVGNKVVINGFDSTIHAGSDIRFDIQTVN
jgi:non-lysosomal glucosylceramidase